MIPSALDEELSFEKTKVQKTHRRSKSVPVISPQARAEEAFSLRETKPPKKEAIISAEIEKATIGALGSLKARAMAEKRTDKIMAVSAEQAVPIRILLMNFFRELSSES